MSFSDDQKAVMKASSQCHSYCGEKIQNLFNFIPFLLFFLDPTVKCRKKELKHDQYAVNTTRCHLWVIVECEILLRPLNSKFTEITQHPQ